MCRIARIVLIMMVAISVTGCSHRSSPNAWVISSISSKSDRYDVNNALQVVQRYIMAWNTEDYQTLWKTRLKVPGHKETYVRYRKMASVWRTKGYKSTYKCDEFMLANTVDIITNINPYQAQVLLAICSVGIDDNTHEKLKMMKWPDRVMFVSVSNTYNNKRHTIILAKNNGDWEVANWPGDIDELLSNIDLRTINIASIVK